MPCSLRETQALTTAEDDQFGTASGQPFKILHFQILKPSDRPSFRACARKTADAKGVVEFLSIDLKPPGSVSVDGEAVGFVRL